METKRTFTKHLLAAAVVVLLAMGIAPMAAWANSGDQTLKAGSSDLQEQAAKSIDVCISVSDKGVLALAHQKITVSDLDKDGKITYDEALQVTHNKYKKGGYEQSGGWATKLWGVTTQNLGFTKNDELNSSPLTETVLEADDELVASVLQDDVNYSDYYAFFNKKELSVKAGKEFKLKLKASYIMSYPPTPAADAAVAPGVKVGTWEKGTFTPLKGKKTGDDGVVTLKFDEPGTYVVSAKGTVKGTNYAGEEVKAPLTAPACIVKVVASNPMEVTSTAKTVSLAKVAKKSLTVSPLKVTNAKGEKSFKVKAWTTKTAKKYCKLNVKNGKVTVKKGTPKGTYKFKVTATASGNEKYLPKSTAKTVKITVK